MAYEVDGWGVGELVVADERVVWHELPWPRAERPSRDATTRPEDPSQTPTHPGSGAGPVVSQKVSSTDRGFVSEVVQLLQAYFTLEQGPFDFQPTLKARFKPADSLSRAMLAFSLDNFHKHF